MSPQFAHRRQHILKMITAANAAADPGALVKDHLQRPDANGRSLTVVGETLSLSNGRLFIISVGKAAVAMARAAAEAAGDLLYRGVSLSKVLTDGDKDGLAVLGITTVTGSHPVAGTDSIAATGQILHLLAETRPDDLVLCLISGGASALLTQPLLPLDQWQQLNKALLSSGCTIQEFNQVRRQLDQVKGGGLARAAAPARVVSLILSDVIGNDLATIGSGPTVPGSETAADALDILHRYHCAEILSNDTRHHLQTALANKHQLAPDHILGNHIIGDIRLAATAVANKAELLGFTPHILTTHLTGEAREVAHVAAALARDLSFKQCYLLGGETTVTLPDDAGLGGRNQELALATAVALAGVEKTAVATYATDGEDGPTDAAGALVSGDTMALARQAGLDPSAALNSHSSYTFFKKLTTAQTHPIDGHLQTGSTGTNVNDLLILLKYEG